MNNMFGGGAQGQFGGASFGPGAMNPMGAGMQFQEVGMAAGDIVFTKAIGSPRAKDRSGRKPWPWSGSRVQGRR